MDNGQATGISLGSKLDINSQDMLVSVSQPKFTYNRQKYQGSLLQTSVRYEADGWFAGWWGHNFELVSTAKNTVTPPLDDDALLSVIRRQDENGNSVWAVQHKDIGLTYIFNPTLFTNWVTGSGTIQRVTTPIDMITIADGKTNKDNNFKVELDPYTGALISFQDIDNVNLTATSNKAGENIRLEIRRNSALSQTDFVSLRTNNIPVLAGINLSTYTYDKSTNISTWNNLFTLKIDSATAFDLKSIYASFEIVAGTVVLSDYNTVNEKIVAEIKDITINNLIHTLKFKSYWVQDLFATVAPLSSNISQQVTASENNQFGGLISQGNEALVYNNSCIYRFGLPVWLQQRLDFDYGVTFTDGELPVARANWIWHIKTFIDDSEAVEPTYPAIDMAGFSDLLAAPRVTIYSYISQAASPFNAVVRKGTGDYEILQPSNPRFSIFRLNISDMLRNNNLFIPTSFQPYRQDENPAYDPRSVVWAGEDVQIFGLTNTGSKAKKLKKNDNKYEQAANAMTIAEMNAIPDSIAIDPFVPEYTQTSGTLDVDILSNPTYQPDPEVASYDPRPIVHAILDIDPDSPTYNTVIIDPAVKPWTNGEAASTNTVVPWGIALTPNYTRYWLDIPTIAQADWDTTQDVGVFWPLYWPTLPVPEIPVPANPRANPYDSTPISGVISTIIQTSTTPDNTDAAEQPQTADGEIAPPRELPYKGKLTLKNFVQKAILHAMVNVGPWTKWEWGITISRIIKTKTRSRNLFSPIFGTWSTITTYQYFNSYGSQVAANADVVWRPMNDNFRDDFDVYDRDDGSATAAAGLSTVVINDTWNLWLRCKNNNNLFPIPTTGYATLGSDASSYFTVALLCTGNFRQNQNLLDISRPLWSIPQYTAVGFEDNYRVLNKINLTRTLTTAKDPGIFVGSNTHAIVNVPLCVPGYAVSEITTPNILASDLTAFTITNNISGVARMFRIDAPTGDGRALNLVKADLLSVMADSNTLYVEYRATGRGPFYQLLKQPYTIDQASGAITGYQDYSYPDWILRNLPTIVTGIGNFNENDYAKLYIPGSQMATTIANINILFNKLDFIETIDIEQQFTTTPYNSKLFEAITPTYTVSKPEIIVVNGVETHNQTLVLFAESNPPDDKFTAVYNPDTTNIIGTPVPTFNFWNYIGYETNSDDKDKVVTKLTIKLQNPESYTLTFKRTFMLEHLGLMSSVSIAKQENHKVSFEPVTYGIVDLTANKLIDASSVQWVQTDTIGVDVIKVYVAVNNSAFVYFKPAGIISRNSLQLVYKSFSGSYNVVFTYKGIEHTLHLDTSTNVEQYLSYRCTDIRTGEITEVYRRELDDIMMFVKQFWSGTVDVENFWWVDSEHVLELAKHTLTLYKKVGIVNSKQSVHDWNGDNWEVQEVGNRATLISTEDLYYSVSSAYSAATGILFKLQRVSLDKIKVLWINPLTMNWDNPVWSHVNISVKQITLTKTGTPLEYDKISSYGALNVDALITTTKISSTAVTTTQNPSKSLLLIGIKQNNGLGQWCIKIDIQSGLFSVLVGYGCVGPKGDLTGGQIPIDYCNGAVGFNGVVKETAALPENVSKIDEVPKLIVGTSSQQWFIQRKMTGIVSHLTFDLSAGSHVPVPLYLNNNVDMLMHWTTYRGARIQDVLPQSLNIASLFGQSNAGINILVGVVSPSFFYLGLFYAVFVGIATSMGTYSYTWRNSNEIKARDAESLTDQEISFGKFEQNLNLSINNKGMHIWAQIIIHMIKTLPDTVAQVVVNKHQGQTTPEDGVGRKFSQLFEDTISSTLSTAIDSNGFNVRAQSITRHQHTLSSFYQINDKIECHAGPGFVNHNLKAQCTAQSMQDIQIDGKQLGFFSVLTALTKLILGAQNAALEVAYNALERGHDTSAQQNTTISPGATINWGYFVSLGISAGMMVTGGMIKLNNMILENMEGIVEAFGGSTEAFLNNWLSAHTPTLEGLHTYGNKSMSFFWPAFGIDKPITYTNERVTAVLDPVDISISLVGTQSVFVSSIDEPDSTNDDLHIYPFEEGILARARPESARIPVIKCLGEVIAPDAGAPEVLDTPAPENMAVVEGTTAFLSKTAFKNEQVGVGPPTFGPPMIHDFMIDKQWALGYTAGAGAIISVSCDDTKLIDGPPSNVIITDDFCGVASPYIALEIKKTFDSAYLRPTLVTANAIGLNINRINCVHDAKAYHAFDGQVNRIVNWVGGTGLDKELLYQQYLFQMNDHFKRSNIFPPAQFFGSFQGPPIVAIRSYEIVSNTIVEQTTGLGFGTSTPGENRNLQRFSTCVFSELLSSLPTTIRTLAPYKLRVNDGVTCLVTELRNTNTRYKAPSSVDFSIGTKLYRKTEEYIVEISEQSGVVMTETRTPSAGLDFVGPTMTAAYFYSPATRLYYEYAGGTELQKQDILNRFKDVHEGRWDFINQEVIFNAELNYTGEEMILRLDQDILGEVWPPNKTIYNERSGFKIYSCAGGLVYQGPKRFIVSRFVTLEHMLKQINQNKRKWIKVKREEFVYERDYGWRYEDWYTDTPGTAVYGWTHNPYLLVTSMLGTSEDIDNKFEWALTFAWSDIMDHVFEHNEYVTVNIMAETVTQGGVVRQRPTHLFLSKELFTRSDNAGYYTIKFQSNSGTGNRERLYIWSDGIIALEDLKLDVKQISSARTQPLVTQADLERLVEL